MRLLQWCALVAACCAPIATATAQHHTVPSARLISAPRLNLPGAVDSNIPLTWDLTDGAWTLYAFASWGSIPVRMTGQTLDRLQQDGRTDFVSNPGNGVWIESVITDDTGAWYAYYHHEIPALECGRPDRSIPRIRSARSTDRGQTWEDVGVVLEAPPDTTDCTSTNRFVLGGVGDVSAMLSPDKTDLFLFFSQYMKDPATQGVAVARLAWADRDAPAGRATVWQQGAWIPPRQVSESSDPGGARWEYPAGTPLVPVSKPWHDGNAAADAFWGPSVHWNAYLERYVMLLNRARDENFNNEGIYVSFAGALDDPRGWSAPQKIMNGGGWYPQVAGLESETGTDKQATRRARFFITGRSEHYIEFER